MSYKAGTIYILTFFMCFVGDILCAQDFHSIKDMRKDWKFYDSRYQGLMPFLDGNQDSPASIHMPLNLGEYSGLYLKMYIPEQTSFLINGKFIQSFDELTTILYSVDSLKSIVQDEVSVITLYNENGFSKSVRIGAGYLEYASDMSMDMNPLVLRENSYTKDYLLLILFLIIAYVTILYNQFSYEFYDLLDVKQVFSLRAKESYHYKYKGLTKIQFLFMALLGMIISFLYLLLIIYSGRDYGMSFLADYNVVLSWVFISVVIFSLIFFKYLLIGSLSLLFDLRDRMNFYFSEYIRMSMVFHFMAFVFSIFLLLINMEALKKMMPFLLYSGISFYGFRALIIFFKFRYNISIQNLHLFSYLCGTEILPIVIGLKYFLLK